METPCESVRGRASQAEGTACAKILRQDYALHAGGRPVWLEQSAGRAGGGAEDNSSFFTWWGLPSPTEMPKNLALHSRTATGL